MASSTPGANTRCPPSILYSPDRIANLRAIIEDLFTHDWLVRPHKRALLQRLWEADDPHDVIRVSRIGRDVGVLLSLGESEQEERVRRLATRIKRLDNDDSQVLDLLHELHVATLFHPPSGLTGRLARDGQEGYDVTVTFPDGRTLWISCKRLTLPEYHARFDRTAETLRSHLQDVARRYGLGGVSGLVVTANSIDVARTHLCALWDSACAERRQTLGWVVCEQTPHLVAVGPGVDSVVGTPCLEQAAPCDDIAISAGVPRAIVYRRFRTVYKDAIDCLTRQMTAGLVPPPSERDAWMVVLDVPDGLALKEMHLIAERDAESGRLANLSALLLTCTTPAAYGWPPHTYTMAEEVALLLNGKAHVPLPTFVGSTPFVLLHEGQHVTEEIVRYARIGDKVVAIPHGFYSPHRPARSAYEDGALAATSVHPTGAILPDPSLPIDHEEGIDYGPAFQALAATPSSA